MTCDRTVYLVNSYDLTAMINTLTGMLDEVFFIILGACIALSFKYIYKFFK